MSKENTGSSGEIIFREPETRDGKFFHEIAESSKTLDVNSTYHYLIMCRHFGKTCLAAEHQGQIVGFVTGYLPPDRPDTLFIWQVAVDESFRGQGIGLRMLIHLFNRVKGSGVHHVHATITTSNEASIRLFTALATQFNAPVEFGNVFFSASDFGQKPHAPEKLFHIGPVHHITP